MSYSLVKLYYFKSKINQKHHWSYNVKELYSAKNVCLYEFVRTRCDYHYALCWFLAVRSSCTIVLTCCLLWALACCENNLVLDFVDVIAVAPLIMLCVGSWQRDLSVSLPLRCGRLCVRKTVLFLIASTSFIAVVALILCKHLMLWVTFPLLLLLVFG